MPAVTTGEEPAADVGTGTSDPLKSKPYSNGKKFTTYPKRGLSNFKKVSVLYKTRSHIINTQFDII